jgi:hypothetical protein
MNSLSSQGLVEEYSEDTSLDGEQSVQSSGKPIQQAFCAPDKMTVFSRLSRFGMTFKPLTENLGEELLTLCRVAFLARTYQPLEKERESMESDQECGEKWRGSFTKYDQDSCSWKTHQCSLLGDLEEFSETWPQWGLMRDGECWERQTLEQTIRGTGFGLSEKIPTPTARDGSGVRGKAAQERKGNPIDTVPIYVQKFPTPTATDYKNQPTSKSWKAKGAVNYKLSNPEIQAKWPTPLSTEYRANRVKRENHHNGLTQAVLATQNSGQLNPTWVEWLMGWPLGWTDLKPLATDKCPCVPQPLGES